MMKTNHLFCAILFACTASFIQCSDDENPTKEPQDCYPTQIPGEEGAILTLSYNDSHQVTDIDFASADEPDTEFTSTLEYTEGKLSKISHYADGEMYSYQQIEYTSNQIIDHQFKLNEAEQFEEQTRYVYELADGRITRKSKHEDYDEFAASERFDYTYNGDGNIIKSDYYSMDYDQGVLVLETTYTFTYDDKVNPFYVSGVNGGDDDLFSILNLSKNNVVQGNYDSQIDNITYTYDSDGKPVTMKRDWQDNAQTFKWACE